MYRYVLLGVLFVLSAVVLGYLMTDVRAKMAELESSPLDNVQWTLTQLEVEYLTLMIMVERVDAQNKSDPIPPDLTELRRRYDIVYSRVKTIRDGALYDPAVSGGNIEDVFQSVAQAIFDLAPQIDQDDDALLADLPQIKYELDVLHPQVRRILTVGNQGLANAEDAARREMAAVLIRVAAATGALLVTLVTMALLFRREAGVSDQRLRENLATSTRLEMIFATSRDAILVIDRAGQVLTMNSAGADMFCADPDATRPSHINELLSHDDADNSPVTGIHLFDAAASGLQTGLRMTGRRRDGTTFPVELSLGTSTRPRTPICVAVARDITHLVQSEEVLRTSRDQARAGERAKARFLGVISHEMRTPLNGILGAIDLIEQGTEAGATDMPQTYLPHLRASSQSLLNLVEDVLDLTQIEDGLKLSPRAFCLNGLLDDIILTQTPAAHQAGNQLTLQADTALGYVMGDPDRLRQVIGNLIANAVKFTQGGEITLLAHRTQGDTVEFQVMDTGLGMSDAELGNAFDDFYRSDAAIDHQIQGTGLGLGIARTLVKAMGGEIGAESEKGEGSVFWVTLPLPLAAPDQPAPVAPQNRPTPPARILLVEDNATNRLIARRLLEHDGHTVAEAADGQACLDLCATTRFDLILMDVSMPVMDGPTAARNLRGRDGPNRDTRIVALTAHLAEGLDHEQFQGAIDAVLHKPMNRNLLNDQIAQAMGTTPGSRQDGPTDPLATLPPETRRRLIDAFIAEAEEELPACDTAASASTAPDQALADRLHALAGAAASLGVLPLHHPLIAAEEAERAGDRATTRAVIAQARQIWPDLRARLAAHDAR